MVRRRKEVYEASKYGNTMFRPSVFKIAISIPKLPKTVKLFVYQLCVIIQAQTGESFSPKFVQRRMRMSANRIDIGVAVCSAEC